MVLKEWTSVSHPAQYVEHNNNIAADFHMVSCIIEFYMKQQGLRKPPPCIFQVNALQRRCMLCGTHEVEHDGAMRRYGFCLVAGLPNYDSSLARETAAWFFYTLSQVK
jgi:hypothetical protein